MGKEKIMDSSFEKSRKEIQKAYENLESYVSFMRTEQVKAFEKEANDLMALISIYTKINKTPIGSLVLLLSYLCWSVMEGMDEFKRQEKKD